MFPPDFPGAIVRPASPDNYNGPFAAPPSIIVLHGTAGSWEAACNWFATPPARRGRLANGQPFGPSSAHYTVAYDGRVAQNVPESHIAWHAGRSRWGPYNDVNPYSIGIELETDVRGYSPWPGPQMAACEALVRYLIAKYRVAAENITTHRLISLAGKIDPLGFPLDVFRQRVTSLPAMPPQAGPGQPPQPTRPPVRRPPGRGFIE